MEDTVAKTTTSETVEAPATVAEPTAEPTRPEVSSDDAATVQETTEPDGPRVAPEDALFHDLWSEWLRENISGGPIGRDTNCFNALQNAAPALLAKLRGRI